MKKQFTVYFTRRWYGEKEIGYLTVYATGIKEACEDTAKFFHQKIGRYFKIDAVLDENVNEIKKSVWQAALNA